MDVHPRHDVPLEVMLDVRELSREIAHMMVVHEGDRRDRVTVRVIAPFLAHQLITNEIAERFGVDRMVDDYLAVYERLVSRTAQTALA